MTRPGAVERAPFSSLVTPVLQEAVSTGDPEMVQVVLQYRDYQRAKQRLAGIPELLNKLRQVQRAEVCVASKRGGEGAGRLRGGHPGHTCLAWPGKGAQLVQQAFPTLPTKCRSLFFCVYRYL